MLHLCATISWFNVNENCKRSCGICVGTAECGNDPTENCGLARMAGSTSCDDADFRAKCSMECSRKDGDMCIPAFESPPKPWWNLERETEEKLVFCKGGQKIMQVMDIDNDGDDDLVCFDWATGEFTKSKSAAHSDVLFSG